MRNFLLAYKVAKVCSVNQIIKHKESLNSLFIDVLKQQGVKLTLIHPQTGLIKRIRDAYIINICTI